MVLRRTEQSRRIFNASRKRTKKGTFAPKTPETQYYEQFQGIPEKTWNPQSEQYEKLTYRAVVTLNGVPIHSDRARGRPRYKNFSYAKVDYYENISIDDMKNKLLQEIADHFKCKIGDLWFADGDGETYFDIESPKPYRGTIWEGLEYGEY